MSDTGKRTGERIAKRWAAIEEEFGEPVRDIILGMRADGHLWSTIAGALGTTERNLIYWRPLLGIPLEPRVMRRDLELLGPRKRDVAAQAKGFANLEDAIRELRAKQWTYEMIGAHLGLCKATIYLAVPAELRGVQMFPPERIEKLREHAKRVFAGKRGHKNHPWRGDERARVESIMEAA